MGVTTDSSQRAFKEEDVAGLFARPRRVSPYEYRAVYIGVDPAGGGNSAFSICSLGRTLDGGITVRFAFAFPNFSSPSHCECLGAPSNQCIWILAKVFQVHGYEDFEEQERDARGSDALAEFAFLLDKVRGHFVFSVESDEDEGSSAHDAFGIGWEGGDLRHHVFDVVVQGVGLVQAGEEGFEACEVDVEGFGRMSDEHRPEWGLVPRFFGLKDRVLAPTVELLVCACHCSQILGMEALRTQGDVYREPFPRVVFESS